MRTAHLCKARKCQFGPKCRYAYAHPQWMVIARGKKGICRFAVTFPKTGTAHCKYGDRRLLTPKCISKQHVAPENDNADLEGSEGLDNNNVELDKCGADKKDKDPPLRLSLREVSKFSHVRLCTRQRLRVNNYQGPQESHTCGFPFQRQRFRKTLTLNTKLQTSLGKLNRSVDVRGLHYDRPRSPVVSGLTSPNPSEDEIQFDPPTILRVSVSTTIVFDANRNCTTTSKLQQHYYE